VPAGRPPRIALAFAALLAVPLAHAEFQDDYAQGLKALDAARYQDARKYLERALAAQAEPVDKIILNGSVEQPYLPYHFLGIIAYKLGECDVAKAQWGNPTNRRMIGRLNQIRQQEQRLADSCQTKVAEAKKEDSSTTAQNVVAPEPAVPATTMPAPAEKPAAKPAPGKERVPAKPTEPEKTAVAKPAEKPADSAAPTERSPPARLVRAVESYLGRRYAEAAGIDPDSFSSARARFHGFLIRAASRFTLAQLNGDKSLLAAARADAASAYKLEPDTAPDEAMYSPKFRAFYAQAH